MKLFKNIIEKPVALLEYIACGIMFICTIITLLNVITRFVFNSPIYGAVEMVQYGVLLAICLGLPSCSLHGGHAKVTILIDALPPSGKKIFNVLVSLISISLFSVISYKLLGSVAAVLKNGRTTEVFRVPYQYIYYAIIFGLVIMVIVLIYSMISELLFRQLTAKKPENGIIDAQ